MLVATFGEKVHFGMPGNPVSTCCNTEIFLKPLLRRAFGMREVVVPWERVELAGPCPRDRERLFFVYARRVVREGRVLVESLGNQNSGNLLLAARGDCLIVASVGDGPLEAGEQADVLPVRRGL